MSGFEIALIVMLALLAVVGMITIITVVFIAEAVRTRSNPARHDGPMSPARRDRLAAEYEDERARRLHMHGLTWFDDERYKQLH